MSAGRNFILDVGGVSQRIRTGSNQLIFVVPRVLSICCDVAVAARRASHVRSTFLLQLPDLVVKSMSPGPIIVITGTPGTGKSTHAQLLVDESPVPLRHINVGEWVKEKGWYEEFDEEWQSYTVDEDKVRAFTGPVTIADILE